MNLEKIFHYSLLSKNLLVPVVGISLLVITLIVTSNDLSTVNAQSNSSSVNPHLVMSDTNQTLGSPIYIETTQSTNMRVLSVDPIPTVEVSYVGNSTINGSPTQTIGTIVDKMGADGAVHSKGQAIILSANGKVLTYKLESKGYYNPDGSFTDNGVMTFSVPFQGSNKNGTIYNNPSSTNSTMEITNMFGIYKKTVDPMGNGFTKVWKWG